MRTKLAALCGSVVLLLGASVAIAPSAMAATTLTWTGGGADANWATPLNWNPAQTPVAGDSLVFPPGPTVLTSTNNVAVDTAFETITFTGTGYSIGGNALKATEIGQTSTAAITTTVTLPIHSSIRVRQDGGDGAVMGITGPVVMPDNGTMVFANNQTVNVTGAISGTNATVTPSGSGRVVLSGANTYTGPTKVTDGDGDLVINGAQPTSAVTINSGILEGTGAIGALTVTAADQKVAVHSPGDPVGTMHASNTNLGANSVLGVEGASAAFGQFDQLAVTGTVALSGDLVVALDFNPAPGTQFTIIDNDGTDAVTGTFAGLAEGAVLFGGGGFFKITYKGGTNNDVVITAVAPPPVSIVTAPGSGGGPNIKSFGGRQLSFFAGAPGTGGASVAAGNVLGHQIDDIVVGSGAGVPSRVIVFNPDGTPSNTNFSPYGDAFTGGVNVGVADIDGDGVDEIITGAGQGGGPNVKVFSGSGTLLRSFFAYPPGFAGGVKVAGGDVTADGADEIITGPGPGGGPNVKAFSADGSTLWLSFNAYADNFGGGVNVAGADVDGDGRSEIVTGAGPGGGPHVRIFGGGQPMGGGFFAYPAAFVGGVFVGSVPNFGGLHDDIVTGAGPGGGPHVKTFSPNGTVQSSFFAYDGAFFGGVRPVGAVLNLPQ